MGFLLLAFVLIVVGVAIVVVRNRRPTGIDAGIDSFERRLEAIAPSDDPRGPRAG